MIAAEIVADLARRGIRLEAHGERLRYYPRSALTLDQLDKLTIHKSELLTLLSRASDFDFDSALDAELAPIIDPVTTTQEICRCGSTTWQDVPIHDGQSIRRDCGYCGRFIEFAVWHGISTGHKDQ